MKSKSLSGLLVLAALIALTACGQTQESGHGEAGHAETEILNGPNGGRLFGEGELSLELAIHERGVPPEFRAWVRRDGELLPPESLGLSVQLKRLDGQVERISFQPEADYLRGQQAVLEPHSFDVVIDLQVSGKRYQWRYSSHEGRVTISNDVAADMAVKTKVAGAQRLQQIRELTGRVHTDPARVARVRPRYAGLIQSVQAKPWDVVAAGQVLARVQSNDSLQSYTLKAPIAGWVVTRNAQVGEVTGDEPLFVIADLSELWVELDVFDHELPDIAVGQPVAIEGLHGEDLGQGVIDRLSPLAIHGAQSVRARVIVPNPEGRLRPGQYVRGRVLTGVQEVPLAVELEALQGFRDFTVVFEKIGETYEVRMLELGERDDRYVQVLSGLKPGARYVTTNSYLIKADIEKSGASHDH